MGVATVRCTAGCACQPSELDAGWAQRASLLQMHSFQVSALGGAALTLLIAAAAAS